MIYQKCILRRKRSTRWIFGGSEIIAENRHAIASYRETFLTLALLGFYYLYYICKMIKWLPYASIARSIARKRWEVQVSYGTSRKWAYYYSCSRHWWFVIAKDTLADEEIRNLSSVWIEPEKTCVKKIRRVDYDGTPLPHKYTYKTWYSYKEPNDTYMNKEFYIFEEDCDWAIVVWLLGIYYFQKWKDKEEHMKMLDTYAMESLEKRNHNVYNLLDKQLY